MREAQRMDNEPGGPMMLQSAGDVNLDLHERAEKAEAQLAQSKRVLEAVADGLYILQSVLMGLDAPRLVEEAERLRTEAHVALSDTADDCPTCGHEYHPFCHCDRTAADGEPCGCNFWDRRQVSDDWLQRHDAEKDALIARLREALEAIVAYRQEIRDACYDLDNDLMARGESVAANICAATAKAALTDTDDNCPDCDGSGYVSDGRGSGEPCGCNGSPSWLQRHDEEVRRGERERCAEKCDELADKHYSRAERTGSDFDDGTANGCAMCAAAIREGDEEE